MSIKKLNSNTYSFSQGMTFDGWLGKGGMLCLVIGIFLLFTDWPNAIPILLAAFILLTRNPGSTIQVEPLQVSTWVKFAFIKFEKPLKPDSIHKLILSYQSSSYGRQFVAQQNSVQTKGYFCTLKLEDQGLFNFYVFDDYRACKKFCKSLSVQLGVPLEDKVDQQLKAPRR